MKAILFTQEDTAGFDALQQKIHVYLTSKKDVDGFKYSANKWADSATAIVHESKLVMPIDESEPRHTYIMEALSQAEKDSIVDITLADPQ
jgi:hypothetical protein